MAEEKNLTLAKSVFATFCKAMDRREWKFEKDEEKLTAHFTVSGDDLLMQFTLVIDAKRQLIRLTSQLPFRMSEERRMDGAIATCVASYGLADGNFDYDLSSGRIFFRMTASFRESLIGEKLFHYMLECACDTVDEYNDKFFAIDKGLLSIDDFIESN